MVDDCKLFKDVDYAKSLPSRNEIIHAAHGLIYARHTNSFESQPQRANVLVYAYLLQLPLVLLIDNLCKQIYSRKYKV